MKEHQYQPFPDPSAVRECSDQRRKSCKQRVDHRQNRQQNFWKTNMLVQV